MSLQDSERRLCRLFCAVVLGRWDEVERLRRAAPPGEPNRAWREALLQAHMFCGFPRAVEAYAVLQQAGGLGRIEPDEVLAEADQPERGRRLFERVYQTDATAIRAQLEAAHPDFAAWVEGHAYGRILARPGLPADRRELLAVCALAALGQGRQLASHVRGSLRCGATRDELRETLEAVADLLSEERLERARSVLEHFASPTGP
jgi:4-carboxymuconolactone decarboxylase